MTVSRKIQMFTLDLFYPNRCPCCGASISWDAYLCENCIEDIREPENTFCPGCGKAYRDCICDTDLPYDGALVLTRYAGYGRRGIFSLKDATSLQFGRYAAQELGARILGDETLCSYDMITPVPMAKKKVRRRYCNPAKVFAKELSRVTGIPLATDLLWDDGTGQTQHALSADARMENISQFHAYDQDLTGFRIFLCDDVLTTGSTMRRCAELLKSKGAACVTAVVMTSTV